MAIRIAGLNEFTKGLRNATEDRSGEKILIRANMRTADLVVGMARRQASNKMERKAAGTLYASKSATKVQVKGGGDPDVPYFGGANFGAYKGKIRLIKAPVTRSTGERVYSRRTRATMVRSGESIDRVARRVEAQYIDARGRNIGRRLGGEQVRLARTKSGKIRKIRGWNQFRRWRKGEDYFLYRAVRKHWQQITNFYLVAMDDAVKEAFPDGGMDRSSFPSLILPD